MISPQKKQRTQRTKRDFFFFKRRLLLGALCAFAVQFLFLSSAGQPPANVTVVLLTMDGVRWDYPEKQDLPAFADMARRGTRAKRFLPAFPSLTQVTHATMATGCCTDKHGIVANSFLDRDSGERFAPSGKGASEARWLKEPPLWALAERAGLRSAVSAWPCSVGPWHGTSPSDYQAYDKKASDRETAAWVLELLRRAPDRRPRLVMAWTGGADGEGHDDGPESESVRKAMRAADGLLADLRRNIRELGPGCPVALIVASDHGMAPVDRAIDVVPFVPKKGYYPFIAPSGPVCNIYVKGSRQKRSVAEGLKKLPPGVAVYEKDKTPEALCYRSGPRIGDFVLLAPPGATFRGYSRKWTAGLVEGQHGYPADNPDMQGVLYAEGPGIPAGRVLDTARGVDVAPTVCALLGIPPPPRADGSNLFP